MVGIQVVRFRQVRLYLHVIAFYIEIDSYIYADYWNTTKCLLQFIKSFNDVSISYTNKLLFCMQKGGTVFKLL